MTRGARFLALCAMFVCSPWGCSRHTSDTEENVSVVLLPADRERTPSDLNLYRFSIPAESAERSILREFTRQNEPLPRTLVVIEALFPDMRPFRDQDREQWFSKNDAGVYGAHKPAVIRIAMQRLEQSSNDSGTSRYRSLSERAEAGSLIIDDERSGNEGLPARMQVYRDAQDRGREYVWPREDGRVVIADCGSEGLPNPMCRATSTWRGELSLRYSFGGSMIAELPAIDAAVDDLIASFSPTRE